MFWLEGRLRDGAALTVMGEAYSPSSCRTWLTSARAPERSLRAVLMFCRALSRSAWLPGQSAGVRLITDVVTPDIDVCDAVTLPVRSLRSLCAAAFGRRRHRRGVDERLQFRDERLQRAVHLAHAVGGDDLVDLGVLEEVHAEAGHDALAVGMRLRNRGVALDDLIQSGESLLVCADLTLECRPVGPRQCGRLVDECGIGTQRAEATLDRHVAPSFQGGEVPVCGTALGTADGDCAGAVCASTATVPASPRPAVSVIVVTPRVCAGSPSLVFSAALAAVICPSMALSCWSMPLTCAVSAPLSGAGAAVEAAAAAALTGAVPPAVPLPPGAAKLRPRWRRASVRAARSADRRHRGGGRRPPRAMWRAPGRPRPARVRELRGSRARQRQHLRSHRG